MIFLITGAILKYILLVSLEKGVLCLGDDLLPLWPVQPLYPGVRADDEAGGRGESV